jgi:chromosome segregation ATPase
MADASAKVRSIDDLESFRSNLIVFTSKARKAVDQVSEEIRRTRLWLESDRIPFWEAELKKRNKRREQAEAELMSARMSDYIDNPTVQQQAVRKCRAAMEEAEEKLKRCKHWARNFENTVQPLAKKLDSITQFIDADMPQAILQMTQLIRALDAYAERMPAELSNKPVEPTEEQPAS